jgi:hypothetical protein
MMGENGSSSLKNIATQVETISIVDDPSKLMSY